MSSEPLKQVNNHDYIECAQVNFTSTVNILGYSVIRATAADFKIELYPNSQIIVRKGSHSAIISPHQWTFCEVVGEQAPRIDTSAVVAHAQDIAPPQHFDNNRERVTLPAVAPNASRRRPGRSS